MSWLDGFFTGIRYALSGGVRTTQSDSLNFGTGFVAAYNTGTRQTDVSIDPSLVPPIDVAPTPTTLLLRGAAGQAKAVAFDSGAAADVLLQRNGATVLTIGTSATAAPSGAAKLFVSGGALKSSPVNAGTTPYQQTIAAAGDSTNKPNACADDILRARLDTASDSLINLVTYVVPVATTVDVTVCLNALQLDAGANQDKAAALIRRFVGRRIGSGTLTIVGALETIGTDRNETALSLTSGDAWKIDVSGGTLLIQVCASNGFGSHAGLFGWSGRVEIRQISR